MVLVALAVLGGAVAGFGQGGVLLSGLAGAVVAAIAFRGTVGNLAAGAGLRLAQPFLPGETIRLYVPSLGRQTEAEIVRVGPANTTLLAGDRLVVVPNTRLLRSAPECAQSA